MTTNDIIGISVVAIIFLSGMIVGFLYGQSKLLKDQSRETEKYLMERFVVSIPMEQGHAVRNIEIVKLLVEAIEREEKEMKDRESQSGENLDHDPNNN